MPASVLTDLAIRKATAQDLRHTSAIFGRAFDDYRRGLNVTAEQLAAFWSVSLAARVDQTTVAVLSDDTIVGFVVTVAPGAQERYGRPGSLRERLSLMRSTVQPSWVWRMPALFIPMGIAYSKRHARKDELYVSLIAVDPVHHGKGVGQALLRAVDAEARSNNAAAILLHTASSNTRARDAYHRAGYELVCTVRSPWPGPARIPAYVAFRKPLVPLPAPTLSASDAS